MYTAQCHNYAESNDCPGHCEQERLASEWDPRLMGKPGQPPRTLDPALLKDVKQVDFVTYIPNPHFQRDKPYGEASKKVALLRNKRLHPKPSATPGCVPSCAPPKEKSYRCLLNLIDLVLRFWV